MISVELGQRWKHERTGEVVTVLRIDYPDSVRVDSCGTERGITRKTLRRNYTQEDNSMCTPESTKPMTPEELAWVEQHEAAPELTPQPQGDALPHPSTT